MKKENYIMKSAAAFRKAYKLPEHKENRLSVFLDVSMLEKSDLPMEVINNAIASANNDKFGLTRLNDFCMCAPTIGKDGLQYCVELEAVTYTVRDANTEKALYSVIEVISYRYSAYKANLYGVYDGLPVKSDSVNWHVGFYNHMHDLYYTEGCEIDALAAY